MILDFIFNLLNIKFFLFHKMKKISVFITNSLGELDVLFPLFSSLSKDKKIHLIFTSDKLYNEFIDNNFYNYLCKELNIKFKKFKTINKFDFHSKIYKNTFYRRSHKLYLRLKLFFLIFDLINSSIIMHETSSVEPISTISYFASKYFGKKILVHHHSQSINAEANKTFKINKRKHTDEKTFLLWHNISASYARMQGFYNHYLIGHPVFYSEWTSLVNKYVRTKKNTDSYIVIFTRGVHENYMEEENYVALLEQSYNKVRKVFGNIKILIKPHPRESIEFIKNLISKNDMKNTFISKLNSHVLSSNSICVISFWTSCILGSLALEKPSIEFFIEPKRFREREYPDGSLHRRPEFGIQCTSRQDKLEEFLIKVHKNHKFSFKKIKSNFNIKDLNCFL